MRRDWDEGVWKGTGVTKRGPRDPGDTEGTQGTREENEGVWKRIEVTKEGSKPSSATPLTLSLGVALRHIRVPIGTMLPSTSEAQIWGWIRRFWGRSRSRLTAHRRGGPAGCLRPIAAFGALHVGLSVGGGSPHTSSPARFWGQTLPFWGRFPAFWVHLPHVGTAAHRPAPNVGISGSDSAPEAPNVGSGSHLLPIGVTATPRAHGRGNSWIRGGQRHIWSSIWSNIWSRGGHSIRINESLRRTADFGCSSSSVSLSMPSVGSLPFHRSTSAPTASSRLTRRFWGSTPGFGAVLGSKRRFLGPPTSRSSQPKVELGGRRFRSTGTLGDTSGSSRSLHGTRWGLGVSKWGQGVQPPLLTPLLGPHLPLWHHLGGGDVCGAGTCVGGRRLLL